MITASPLGEEEAVPEDEERGTVAVPVPKATRGRGSGDVGDAAVLVNGEEALKNKPQLCKGIYSRNWDTDLLLKGAVWEGKNGKRSKSRLETQPRKSKNSY